MTRMMNLIDVRNMLGLGTNQVIRLVQSGELRCYRYSGTGVLNKNEVTVDTHGLRFRESDVEELLEASLIR